MPLKPPILRSAATTRCHGTASLAEQPESGAKGFLRIVCPTALAQPPVARATSPYVVTRPAGTLRTTANTVVWKGVRFIFLVRLKQTRVTTEVCRSVIEPCRSSCGTEACRSGIVSAHRRHGSDCGRRGLAKCAEVAWHGLLYVGYMAVHSTRQSSVRRHCSLMNARTPTRADAPKRRAPVRDAGPRHGRH